MWGRWLWFPDERQLMRSVRFLNGQIEAVVYIRMLRAIVPVRLCRIIYYRSAAVLRFNSNLPVYLRSSRQYRRGKHPHSYCRIPLPG